MNIRRYLTAFMLMLCCINAPAWAKEALLTQAPSGKSLALSSLKGKWVYINYWANWCQPCLDEIAAFNQFYDRYKHKNIAVFGINYDGLSPNELAALIQQTGLHYPSLTTDAGETLALGDIRAVPVTFIFNPEGKLHDVRYGKQTLESLSSVL